MQGKQNVDNVETISEDAKENRSFRWPHLIQKNGKVFAFGGDYNPDQWDESTWQHDVDLLRQAKVTMVSLPIFSWSKIQPNEHTWNFSWLDTIINMLGKAGISIDLATPTAAAPLWLYKKYPQILPVEANGDVVNPGSRQSWKATSEIYRTYAAEVCRKMAEHYKDNPYIVSWHLGNEYGWNNRHDYSEETLLAFQKWCKNKYGTIENLNACWGTAFWSQTLYSFDGVILPKHMGDDGMVNPAHKLDFERFSSDILQDFYEMERSIIERIQPDKPCTTNFMISTDQCPMDYARWSKSVDFVSNDHYFSAGKIHLDELLCSDAYVRSLAQNQPWCLMEHSTSAVQWKDLNSRKKHGELIRDAIAHVGSGANGINFFQCKQSQSGAEAFHSAMIPHAGQDSNVYRDVCKLGDMLEQFAQLEMLNTTVQKGTVAIAFDASCEWMTESKTLPSKQLNHWHDVRLWYQSALDAGFNVDVVPIASNWSSYKILVLPTLIGLSVQDVAKIEAFVSDGGILITNYATGITDDSMRVALGGYPGMLLHILGVRSEEFNILGVLDGVQQIITLDDGSTCSLWANDVTSVASSAHILRKYSGSVAEDWDLAGKPAIVSNSFGKGTTYYVGCDLTRDAIAQLLATIRTNHCDNVTSNRVLSLQYSHDKDLAASDKFNIQPYVLLRRSNAMYDFDFYYNRTSEPITLTVEKPQLAVYLHRTTIVDDEKDDSVKGTYTIGQYGALVLRYTK